MTKNKDGASITVTVRKTHKGEIRGIEISDGQMAFAYRCPENGHSVYDQLVIEQLLAQVRATAKQPRQ
jgi:hypothetical protein